MIRLRTFLLAISTLLFCTAAQAQQKPTDLDKSPMDVSYCPAGFPILKMNGKASGDPVARVLYSRPQRNGRTIFGNVVQYGDLWRMGANEATEIEFYRPVKMGGKMIPKGRYSLYCIAGEKEWTVLLNTDRDIWGIAHNEKKDFAQIKVPVVRAPETAEALTMYFEQTKNSGMLMVHWENAIAGIPFSW